LKTALILSVRANGPHQFCWTWRAEHGADQSQKTFTYFYDCLDDARQAGYTCRFERNAAAPHVKPSLPNARRTAGGSAGRRA
jgi:hypothetical protein